MRNDKHYDEKNTFFPRVDYVERWNSTSVRTFHATTIKYRSQRERNRSGGITVIMLQDTTKSMLAFDLAGIKRNDVVFVVRFSARQGQQIIIQTLMGPAFKIIGNVFGIQCSRSAFCRRSKSGRELPVLPIVSSVRCRRSNWAPWVQQALPVSFGP